MVELTTTGSSLYTITPCRVFDTRNPTGPYGGPSIGAGATRAFTIWGQCGIPASGPRAVALNLTAVNPPVGGSLTLFPTDVAFPGTSSISVKTGVTRANNAIIGLSAAGSLSLNNSLTSSIDMVLDVSGYFIDPPPAARYFFYTPEMNLLAETGITPNGTTPAPLYEYIWFGGRPVAQETVGSSSTRWTMTDHLGTPFLQMDSTKTARWRAEYEPFGSVYAYTTGAPTDPQPLRFPGQEERSTSPARSYNVSRWYRPDNGQYTQPDPIFPPVNRYLFVAGNPLVWSDPLGLSPKPCCDPRREEENIRRRLNRLREIFGFLEQNGTLPITGTTPGGAMTFCVEMRMMLPNGSFAPAQYQAVSGETIAGARATPCVRNCFEEHERVHRSHCNVFKAAFGLLTTKEDEQPAYMNEIGCLLKTLSDAGLRRPE
jgi:RHS repeat-associated protein